jgi:hypothetical protein
MCEHCGSRVHETDKCRFPPEEKLYAFRKPTAEGALTPHQALRILERELKINEGQENEAAREAALNRLWNLVLTGE